MEIKVIKKFILDLIKGIAVATLIFTAIIVLMYFKQKNLSKPYLEHGAIYTVAHVTYASTGSSPIYRFWFKYNGKEYKRRGVTGITDWNLKPKVKKGYKGYIMFPNGMPEVANMFVSYMLPEHMEEIDVPRNGWTLEELQKLDTLFNPDDHYLFFEPRLDAE